MGQSLSRAVADGLRRERASRRLTQEEVAVLLGVSRSFVADVETERRKVTADDLVTICGGLGLRLRDVIAGEGAEGLVDVLGC